MARIRTLKPGFFRSRSLGKCDPLARLTFAGMWTEADDHGRGVADARLIKGAIWALDDHITHLHVAAHINMLAATDHIILYRVGDETYYQVINWEPHQSAAFRRGNAQYPDVSAGERIDSLESSSCMQDDASRTQGSAGTGNREQGTGRTPPATPPERAAEDVEPEIVDEDPGDSEESTGSTEVDIARPVTAQTIVGALVDECKRIGLDLPKRLLGQYAKGIKDLLDEGHPPERIWAALRLMAEDNILNRPSLLANKVVTVQTGPERAPRRESRSTTDERVAGWLSLGEELAA